MRYSDIADWQDWRPFPDPRKGEWLLAPFGPGIYELRLGSEKIKVGKAKNVAYRMSSLIPEEWGSGTRNNAALRQFVWEHLANIEYRCHTCQSEVEAAKTETEMLAAGEYRFR